MHMLPRSAGYDNKALIFRCKVFQFSIFFWARGKVWCIWPWLFLKKLCKDRVHIWLTWHTRTQIVKLKLKLEADVCLLGDTSPGYPGCKLDTWDLGWPLGCRDLHGFLIVFGIPAWLWGERWANLITKGKRKTWNLKKCGPTVDPWNIWDPLPRIIVFFEEFSQNWWWRTCMWRATTLRFGLPSWESKLIVERTYPTRAQANANRSEHARACHPLHHLFDWSFNPQRTPPHGFLLKVGEC